MSMFDKTRPAFGLLHGPHADQPSKPKARAQRFAQRAGMAAVAVFAGLTLTGCKPGSFSEWFGGAGRDGNYECPLPPTRSGDSFNDQEQKIRAQRKAAFDGDFFAQLALANHYLAKKATDKNIEDPIEAAVWLTVALTNPSGYEPMGRFGDRRQAESSRYDKCRAYERERAYRMLDETLSMMDSTERDNVRDRVVYVLSSQGAEGFRTLARVYDDQFGPMGEPADDRNAVYASMRNQSNGRRHARSLFQRNDVDAYLYSYKAVNTGDFSAYVLLKDFEASDRDRKKYSAFVEAKAKRWVPPFEFYPPDPNQPGAPALSDESRRTDAELRALFRVQELPFVHVGRALRYLRIAPSVSTDPREVTPQTLIALRSMVGMPSYPNSEPTRITGLDYVRAIQSAAIYGDPRSQLVLAVMYSCGVGVPEDNARAFFWYQQAARQGSPEAKYAMATFFSLGLAGVSDQNRAQAVTMRLAAALDGFQPKPDSLRRILDQVARQGNGDIGPRYDPSIMGGYDAAADASDASMSGGADIDAVAGEPSATDQ